jgi:rRNA-processing protein FCF1
LEESIKTIKNKKNHLFLTDLKNWVKDVVCENQYKKVDSLLNDDVLKITENIENKKELVSIMTESKEVTKNNFTPFIENVVKYNLEKYIDGLEPEALEQLDEVFSKKDFDLKSDFDVLKENTIIKLKNYILTNNDNEIKQKLNETIDSVEKEAFNRLNYLKLQNLYEGL